MFRLGKASKASLMLYVEALSSTPSPEMLPKTKRLLESKAVCFDNLKLVWVVEQDRSKAG